MSTNHCEKVDRCPIVKYFTERHWDLMLNRYCQGEYNKCYRFQLGQKGEKVADYVMPWDGVSEINYG